MALIVVTGGVNSFVGHGVWRMALSADLRAMGDGRSNAKVISYKRKLSSNGCDLFYTGIHAGQKKIGRKL